MFSRPVFSLLVLLSLTCFAQNMFAGSSSSGGENPVPLAVSAFDHNSEINQIMQSYSQEGYELLNTSGVQMSQEESDWTVLVTKKIRRQLKSGYELHTYAALIGENKGVPFVRKLGLLE